MRRRHRKGGRHVRNGLLNKARNSVCLTLGSLNAWLWGERAQNGMLSVRRSWVFVALAALAPLILLGILLIAGSIYSVRIQIEQETLARSAEINARVDVELMIDRGSLLVLASSSFLKNRDWPAAANRAREVQAMRAKWRDVLLTDAATMKVVWETSETDLMSPFLAESISQFLKSGATATIGGTETATSVCRCIVMHQIVVIGADTFVLSVEREVDDFQAFLTDIVQPPEVGAIVDRNGAFIARTLDIEARFASQATQYVRGAVERGGAGVYDGVTFEQLRNQTAYVTSSVSGWSSHIALPAARVDILGVGSIGTAIFAVVAALLFALGVAILAFREAKTRRLAERSRFQSQKLEALGHLSGTVAHDFNNLLAVIIASFKLIERGPLTDSQKQIIVEGMKTVDKSSALIQQLLGFARAKPIALACVDLAAEVRGCQNLLAGALGSSVTLEIDLAADHWYITTNRDQLELALLNLATNARDAMPEGGRFTISASQRVRGQVDLVIADDGPGMTEELAARVTEPYFTTKPEGKGTGLGLAQVQLLASQSGGSLHLETAPGKGTKFTLRMPSCDPAAL